MSKEDTDKKIQEITDFAELGEFIHQPLKTYSSGMKARLGFAVAINIDPDILIVDEALAVGDMNFQAKCMTAMKNIQQSGATVLFVSHSIASVRSLCQKAVYLKQGNMIEYGVAKDVTERYIKDMNEEQLKQNNAPVGSIPSQKADDIVTLSKNIEFKAPKEFEDRVKIHRHGSGEAKITFVELINSKNQVVKKVEFNEEVKIRIYFESYTDIPLTVNFQIQDMQKNNITSGGFRQAGEKLLSNTKDGKYIVEYSVKLPLASGNYSILASIRTSVVLNKVGKVIDYISDAYVFQVSEAKVKRWCKVDLFPKLDIIKVDKNV